MTVDLTVTVEVIVVVEEKDWAVEMPERASREIARYWESCIVSV